MVDALAYSSNVYMFVDSNVLLGGSKYIYDGPLKINEEAFDTLRNDLGELRLGVKTGLDVSNEAWDIDGNNVQVGCLLDAMISRYDTLHKYSISTIRILHCANGGKKESSPHLLLDSYTTDEDGEIQVNYEANTNVLDDVSNQTTAFGQIKQGMIFQLPGTEGTAHILDQNHM